MKTTRFKEFISEIQSLNTLQQRVLKDVIHTQEKKKEVSLSLETDSKDILCPHCKSLKHTRWGKRNDLQRYKCSNCNRTFNSLSGTPLARLHKKGHWLEYSDCLVQGFSIRKAAALCSVSIGTSFRWRHRFLDNTKSLLPEKISGIVEADETYFLKSEKGNKQIKRKSRKRGGKANKRGISNEQVCVFVSRDRNKNTYDKIFEKFNSDNLTESFSKILSKDALLCTDKKSVYMKFTKGNKYKHGYINISKGERVKKEIIHIQNINSYHSRLKEWIRRFHGVATKYLENYLSWFRELDECNMQTPALIVLRRAKSIREYPYQPVMRT